MGFDNLTQTVLATQDDATKELTKKQIKDLEAQLEELKKVVSKAEDEALNVKSLKTQIAHAEKAKTDAEEALSVVKTQASEAQVALDTLNAEKDAKTADKRGLLDTVSTLAGVIVDKKTEIADLDAQLAVKEASLKTVEASMVTNEAICNDRNAEGARTQEKIDTLTETRNELDIEIANSMTTLEDLSRKTVVATAELSNVTSQVDAKTAQLTDLTAKIATLQDTFDKENKAKVDALKAREAACIEREGACSYQEGLITKKTAELKAYKVKLDEYKLLK